MLTVLVDSSIIVYIYYIYIYVCVCVCAKRQITVDLLSVWDLGKCLTWIWYKNKKNDNGINASFSVSRM